MDSYLFQEWLYFIDVLEPELNGDRVEQTPAHVGPPVQHAGTISPDEFVRPAPQL